MRIGIDVRPLQTDHRYRGVGEYLHHLLEALAEVGRDHEFVLYAYRNADGLDGLDLTGMSYSVRWLRPRPGHALAERVLDWVWSANRPRRGELDVLLQPDASYRVRRVPVVAVAYDLIELVFADHYHPALLDVMARGPKKALGSLARRWLYRRSLRNLCRAARVVAISQSTRDDLIRHLSCIDPSRVSVTPLAADASYRPAPDPELLLRLGVRGRYVLYVGGGDFRKNVVALIDAFERLKVRDGELQLVLVGRTFDRQDDAVEHAEMWRRIDASPFVADIVVAGYLPPHEVRGLYSAADVLAYPSLYEGFGIPPLEAMACGCPVIAYDNSAIPEVVGPAAVLLPNGGDLGAALAALLADDARRAELSALGRQRASRFSWERTARETLAVLEDVSGG
jgi:glycosyltransferase involved in cell wall biosynthesis